MQAKAIRTREGLVLAGSRVLPQRARPGSLRISGPNWKLGQKLQLGASQGQHSQGQEGPVPCSLVAKTQGQHYSGQSSEKTWLLPGLEAIYKENTTLTTTLMCNSNEPH